MGRVSVRGAASVVVRYAVVYPLAVVAVAYAGASADVAGFETLLFAAFAATVVALGFGAMGGSSSTDSLQYGAGSTSTGSPGERWEAGALVKLALVAAGLAGALTVHAAVWA